jgi:predicted permease
MRDIEIFVRAKLAPLALPPDREQKIVEEWAAQIEDACEALRDRGLSDEEAWAEVQRQMPDWNHLGRDIVDAEPVLLRLANPAHGPLAGPAKQTVVAAIRSSLAQGFVRDLVWSGRRLVTERGFSAAVVLTLAICLGANAAVFTVVHAVLLKPLPIPDAGRVVAMGDVYPTVTPNDILSNDAPSYADRLKAVTALEAQALFTMWYDTVLVDGVPEELRGMRATPSLFRVLRVLPAIGRAFTDTEGQPGSDRSIILSHALWQRLYGGDERVIGQALRLGWTGQPYTIVGVMPRGFSFFGRGSDGHAGGDAIHFWIPLALTPAQLSDSARTRYGYFHVGRMRSDATLEQVRAQLDAVNAANFRRLPALGLAELGMYTAVTPLQEALTRNVRRVLYLLWGAAGLVALIGAINIAHLALAQSSARGHELTMRLALGASRARLTRQLIVEGLVPAVIGGIAALAVGAALLQLLHATGITRLPNAASVRMDWTVAGYVAALSAVVGVLIGLVPAGLLRRLATAHMLADRSRVAAGGRTSRVVRRGLVVAQVALSVVLLVGATLLLTSFRKLLQVDAGFAAARVATATIFPPPSRYPNPQEVTALLDRVLDRVRALPGVDAAGITSNIALSGGTSPAAVADADRPAAPGEAQVFPSVVVITSGYFEAMSTRLVRGRHFTPADDDRAPRVAIVDERLAARFWPTADPIGKRLVRGADRYTVVGVVADVHFESVAGQTESTGTAYFAQPQAPPIGRLRWIAVKTSGDAAALLQTIRTAVAAIDPDLPLSDMQTMSERLSGSLVAERLAMRLATMFGLVALFLSMLGVYGVLASLVARRRREIGVRIALGSTVRGIFGLIFTEGAALIATGLLLGLAGAIALGRTLQDQLFGVEPTDPMILSAVAIATGLVALLACVAPARRAARVDPVVALGEP